MEMRQVRYFLSMARVPNFTHAAHGCNVTQPSLTRALQKLEQDLGGPLFRRERGRTYVTDLGRLMLPHLTRTFDAAQAAKQLARGVGRAEVASRSVGCPPWILTAFALGPVAAGGMTMQGRSPQEAFLSDYRRQSAAVALHPDISRAAPQQ